MTPSGRASLRRSTDLSPEVARARVRYETVKTALGVLTTLFVMIMLGVVMWSTLETRRLAQESRDTAQTVEALLKIEQDQAASRQSLIDDAVRRIAAEQYRALVAHDARTEALLKSINRGVKQELHAPQNQEGQRSSLIVPATPAPLPLSQAPAPAPAPAVRAPSPRPAPAPSPPCDQRGKSGKCRKK